MNNWLFWGLLIDAAFTVAGALISVYRLGKPSKPTTPGVVVGIVAIDAVLTVIVILAALEIMR